VLIAEAAAAEHRALPGPDRDPAPVWHSSLTQQAAARAPELRQVVSAGVIDHRTLQQAEDVTIASERA